MTPLYASLAVYAAGVVTDAVRMLIERRDERADLRRCWREWDAGRVKRFECHGVTIEQLIETDKTGNDEDE